MRVAAVIPALEEEPTVGAVVAGCVAAGISPIVVDDGSTDRTGEVARLAGARVLRHDANLGKGAALATGFAYALLEGFEGAIVLDADGQHDPAWSARFVACAEASGADLVIGTRMRRRAGMPMVRWATNAVMSNLLSMVSGVRLSDTQCGMKLLSRRALELVLAGLHGPARLAGKAARFDVESEIVLAVARAGYQIREVAVGTIYIPGRASRIKPIRDTIRFLRLVVRYVFRLD